METPLIDKRCLLKKFKGKGGWTYTELPGVLQDKKARFGWVRVKGTIDGFEIKNYNLMPMSNGNLFLPIKAQIRKAIKKEEGDYVHVLLYKDNSLVEVPEELKICLSDEPMAYRHFMKCTESEKKGFIDWIYSAKKEDTKVKRIAKVITMLQKGEKLINF